MGSWLFFYLKIAQNMQFSTKCMGLLGSMRKLEENYIGYQLESN